MTIEEHLSRFATLVIAQRRAVTAAVIATSLVLGAGLLNIQIEVDPDQQLPQAHPYIQALNRTHRLFGDKNLVIIGITPTQGDAFNATFLQKVRSITQRISELPGVDPTLLRSLASHNATTITRSSDELVVRPALPEDLTDSATSEVRKLAMSDPILRGTLVSYDESTLAIYCTIELTQSLPGYVNVHRAIRDILDTSNDGTYSYLLSGPVVIASQLSLEANKMSRYFILSLLVIGLAHYHAFRSWQAVILPILTGLLAVAWAIGLMGHLSVPLDPFNATTPILILAIGAGHAVQLLKRYYEELEAGLSNHDSIVRSVATVGGVMIASGTIAVVSFLSLAMLGTQSMRTFGILTAFGVGSALLIEMTLIPAVRSMVGHPLPPSPSTNTAPHYILRSIARITGDRTQATKVLLVYGVLIATCGWMARRIEVDTSFKRNLSPTDQARIDDDNLNRLFAGTNDLLFLIEAPEADTLTEPSVTAGIDRFQRRLEQLPGVGKTLSYVDTLRSIHSAIRESSDPSELPDSAGLTSQYLFLYSLSGGDDLSTMLSPDHRIAKITTLLRYDSTQYGAGVIAQSRRFAQEELPPTLTLSVAGTLASNAALTEVMVRGKLFNVLQVIMITSLVAGVVFRSLLLGVLVVVPVVAALLLNFGLMGALGIPMDVATSVVTALSVGIGADYAVYFLSRIQEELRKGVAYEVALERALTTSGTAIVFVGSAIALGYLVLCGSGLRLFVQLGSMVALAMATAMGSTLVILPSLLTLIPAQSRPGASESLTAITPSASTARAAH